MQINNDHSSHGSRVILIAEGHEILQRSLKDLVMTGFPDALVLTVYNGKDAVWLSREHGPAAVILDVDLPELNGIETTMMIHDNSEDTPIVLIQAAKTAEHRASAIAAGASGYVTKQKLAVELIPVLKELLPTGNWKPVGKA
ncbi:MAG: response regulator [Desulfobulbaceae bacterium]|nr:response regulator [Desulfobulbaceae bacterium]